MPVSPMSYYTVFDNAGNSVKAEATKAIAAGAGTTLVKGASGRVVNVIITAAGTSSDNAVVYDNTAGSGAILAVIPGGTTLTGASVAIDMPAANGITVVNVSGGPGFTLGYS